MTLEVIAALVVAVAAILGVMIPLVKSIGKGIRAEAETAHAKIAGNINTLRADLTGNINTLTERINTFGALLRSSRTELSGSISTLRADLTGNINTLNERINTLNERTASVKAMAADVATLMERTKERPPRRDG